MEFVLPLCVMAFLKIFLTFRLLSLAYSEIKKKNIKLSQFRLYEGDFPDKLWSARYQFQNMFEVPILFYVLCLINMNLKNYNQIDIILAWGFVVFRVLHFFIRLKNQRNLNIRSRTLTFVLSLIFLTIGWINLLINFIKIS
ncbi:MAG: hypothetical protein CMF80_00835 [Candidatus Marinimicrobia bacterium]|nr:hypothetical protein [Candidatus Neomarinimicrobiota bacterium]